jgi:hypothetical protein
VAAHANGAAPTETRPAPWTQEVRAPMPTATLSAPAVGLLEAIRECASLVDLVDADDARAVDAILDRLDALTKTVIRRESPRPH